MQFRPPVQLSYLAALVGAKIVGDANYLVSGINEIHRVEPGDLAFVDHPKYYAKTLESAATVILINKEVAAPAGKHLLLSDDPFRDFQKIIHHFSPFVPATSAISPSATIGANTVIQPNCFIGNDVTIGANCIIHSNVSIYDGCTIGNNVIIHANTSIGADAFYYKKRPTGFDKLPSCGTVVIEDDVEIGALCSIDKGVSAVTRIGRGTKIDAQVHIAHDTIIGENCLFAAHVGIAGCTKIGNNVTLWGQVGISSGLEIADGVTVLAQSGVGMNLEAGKTYFGSPAQEAKKAMRELFYLRNSAKKATE